MKRVLFLLGLGCALVAGAGAETIRLTDGRTFESARVISASPGRVCIRHAGGLVQVERGLLPPELAERFPADPEAVAAEDAKRVSDAERKAVKDERAAEEFKMAARTAQPAPQPVAASADAIRETAEDYARSYFRNKYQSGANDSVTLRVMVETEDPQEMSGWMDQWRVSGEASFTQYRSYGWGTYQKESRRFEAVVYAPAGAAPRVKDFTLR
ncbi:MAG TPA: hypothetical protein VK178_02235 [Opitutaceae bacterium]|nr:hypothetical protein [Opitutaceae bacterium]